MIIEKKVWPEYFEKILSGEKNADIRLADFDLKIRDKLVLREYDPNTRKYSGRKITKKVKNLNKISLDKMYNLQDIKKHGVYLIELE